MSDTEIRALERALDEDGTAASRIALARALARSKGPAEALEVLLPGVPDAGVRREIALLGACSRDRFAPMGDPELIWTRDVRDRRIARAAGGHLVAHATAIAACWHDATTVLDPLVGSALWSTKGLPIVSGDVAFVTLGDETRKTITVRDAWTGASLWSTTIQGDVCVYGASEGAFVALSAPEKKASRGRKLSAYRFTDPRAPLAKEPAWSVTVPEDARVEAVSSGIVLLSHTVTSTEYRHVEGRLLALELASGERRFELKDWEDSSSSPRRRSILADADGLISTLGPDWTEEPWHQRTEVSVRDARQDVLWQRDAFVLSVAAYSPGLVLLRNKDGLELVERMSGKTRSDPESVLAYAGAEVAYARDTLYVATGSRLHAFGLDLAPRWELDLGAVPGGPVRSLSALPGRLYGMTEEGVAFCIGEREAR